MKTKRNRQQYKHPEVYTRFCLNCHKMFKTLDIERYYCRSRCSTEFREAQLQKYKKDVDILFKECVKVLRSGGEYGVAI